MNTSDSTKNFLQQVTMNVIATLNRNISLENMVLCYFNIRPKLKYKHICNLINELHGVPLTMRRLLQICKKLGLSRQRNIDDGTLYSILSNELAKYQFMYALIYVSTYYNVLRLVAKRRDIKSFITLHEIRKMFYCNILTFLI